MKYSKIQSESAQIYLLRDFLGLSCSWNLRFGSKNIRPAPRFQGIAPRTPPPRCGAVPLRGLDPRFVAKKAGPSQRRMRTEEWIGHALITTSSISYASVWRNWSWCQDEDGLVFRCCSAAQVPNKSVACEFHYADCKIKDKNADQPNPTTWYTTLINDTSD